MVARRVPRQATHAPETVVVIGGHKFPPQHAELVKFQQSSPEWVAYAQEMLAKHGPMGEVPILLILARSLEEAHERSMAQGTPPSLEKSMQRFSSSPRAPRRVSR